MSAATQGLTGFVAKNDKMGDNEAELAMRDEPNAELRCLNQRSSDPRKGVG
jgi:hypothetical protein